MRKRRFPRMAPAMRKRVARDYHLRLWKHPLASQITALGCHWDAREEGLSGDVALSVALSCHVSHGGGIGPRGLTGVV